MPDADGGDAIQRQDERREQAAAAGECERGLLCHVIREPAIKDNGALDSRSGDQGCHDAAGVGLSPGNQYQRHVLIFIKWCAVSRCIMEWQLKL